MTDLNQLLDRFSAAAEHLNQASDSINDIIRNVEKRLVDSRPGFEFYSGSEIEPNTNLGFAKFGDAWHLVLSIERDGYDEPESQVLLQAPRTTRINALRHLPLFLELYLDEVEKATKTIEESKLSLK